MQQLSDSRLDPDLAPGRPPIAPGCAAGERCPKCHGPVGADDDACRACGLLRGRFAGYRPPGGGAASEELQELWRAVERDWPREGAHEAFLERAAAEHAFGLAAARYREAAARDPSDPLAAAQLARIHRMVMAVLAATAPPPRAVAPAPRYRVLSALFVLLALAAAAPLVALAGHGARAQARRAPGAPARAPLYVHQADRSRATFEKLAAEAREAVKSRRPVEAGER